MADIVPPKIVPDREYGNLSVVDRIQNHRVHVRNLFKIRGVEPASQIRFEPFVNRVEGSPRTASHQKQLLSDGADDETVFSKVLCCGGIFPVSFADDNLRF